VDVRVRVREKGRPPGLSHVDWPWSFLVGFLIQQSSHPFQWRLGGSRARELNLDIKNNREGRRDESPVLRFLPGYNFFWFFFSSSIEVGVKVGD